MSVVSIAEVAAMLGKAASLTEGERGLLNMLLPLVQRTLEKRIHTRIERREFTELLPAVEGDVYYDGDTLGQIELAGGRVTVESRGIGSALQLGNIPVRTITSLHLDTGALAGTAAGAFGAGTLLTEGTDFYRDLASTGICTSGRLFRAAGDWPNEPRCVRVVYEAGYSAAELAGDPSEAVDASDLRLAMLQCAAASFTASKRLRAGAIKSESLGDYSVQYSGDDGSGVVTVVPASVLKAMQGYVNYGAMI